jgi:hypothetical protein
MLLLLLLLLLFRLLCSVSRTCGDNSGVLNDVCDCAGQLPAALHLLVWDGSDPCGGAIVPHVEGELELRVCICVI